MLRRLGKTGAEVYAVRHQHEVYWEDAVGLIQNYFGASSHAFRLWSSGLWK